MRANHYPLLHDKRSAEQSHVPANFWLEPADELDELAIKLPKIHLLRPSGEPQTFLRLAEGHRFRIWADKNALEINNSCAVNPDGLPGIFLRVR